MQNPSTLIQPPSQLLGKADSLLRHEEAGVGRFAPLRSVDVGFAEPVFIVSLAIVQASRFSTVVSVEVFDEATRSFQFAELITAREYAFGTHTSLHQTQNTRL